MKGSFILLNLIITWDSIDQEKEIRQKVLFLRNRVDEIIHEVYQDNVITLFLWLVAFSTNQNKGKFYFKTSNIEVQ